MIGKIPDKRSDGKSSFKALISYCMTQDPVKAAHIGFQHVLSPETAATEMEALATENRRCKDPVFHLILSWREMESPTSAQADEAARIALRELGLEDCQALWVLQRDTENPHVHIVVNRIHPETHRAITPANGWTYKAVEKAARKIELAQGWEVEQNGFYVVTEDCEIVEKSKSGKRSISQNAKDSEVHTAIKSAERVAQEIAAPVIRNAKSWHELHKNLAAQGIAFEKKGSGAILWIGEKAVKASTAGRDISLSKLCDRLGTFEPRSTDVAIADRPQEPIEKVERSGVKSDWERYVEARIQYYKDKSEAYASLMARHKKDRAELREIQKDERTRAFAGSWKGRGALLNRQRSVMAAKHQGEKLNLIDIQKKEIEQFRQAFPRRFANFKKWLEQDDDERTPILNYRYSNQGAIRAAIDGSVAPLEADLRLFKAKTSNKGGVAYIREGEQGSENAGFIDYGKRIILSEKSGDAEILAALQLANQKWGAADIQGTEAYEQKCIELAATHNLRISNPNLAQQVEEKRKEKMQAHHDMSGKAEEKIAIQRPTTPVSTNTALDTNGAYWSHYRDIISKFKGGIDYSRVDAMIGIRMRVTGHSANDVQNAIEESGPTMRRENMSVEAFEAKYRNRDWHRYAAETTKNFVFGARGTIQYGRAMQHRPHYLRIEGRTATTQPQQEAQKRNRGR